MGHLSHLLKQRKGLRQLVEGREHLSAGKGQCPACLEGEYGWRCQEGEVLGGRAQLQEQVTGAAGQGLLSGTGISEAVLMEWWLGHWAWLSSLLGSGV